MRQKATSRTREAETILLLVESESSDSQSDGLSRESEKLKSFNGRSESKPLWGANLEMYQKVRDR